MKTAAGTAAAKAICAIVCTHNRYDVLPDALASLMEQSLARSQYDVIVVDNSTDLAGRKSFWQRYRNRFGVTVEFSPVPGLSAARNRGVSMTNAPVVAFCDDDAVVCPGWLAALVEVFRTEPTAGVVGGPVIPIWPGTPPPWLHPWIRGFFTIVDHGDRRRMLGENEWLAGTNVAFRRSALIEAGGFNENLGRRSTLLLSNEDIVVARKLAQLGHASFYEPTASVHHKVHADRVNRAWLRRRVAWQVISDALVSPPEAAPEQCWSKIGDYMLRMPPEMRTFRGLFLDTDDPATLQRQCDAITAFMTLLMADGHDPEARLT
jgi:glucosyl-dolichyl phosphate glucuronosyltransferase